MIKFALTVALLSLLSLSGCDRVGQTPTKASSTTTQNVGIEADVAVMEQGVRLAAANKRIDELEARVEALKTNPQSIQVDLLKQRLEAIEKIVYARNYVGSDTVGHVHSNSAPDRTGATVRPNATTVTSRTATDPKQQRKTTVKLPTSRPATTAEAEAFTKGGQ